MKNYRPCLALLVLLAALALLTSVRIARAVTFGEPDGNNHPNVGAIMCTWPDDLGGGRWPFSSGTLVYKGRDSQGRWIGVLLTAGHTTENIETDAANGEQYVVTVNFTPDCDRDYDIHVIGIHTLLIERPAGAAAVTGETAWGNFNDWDDVGILVIQVDDPADLPNPAALAPVGFLDQFSKQELQETQFLGVGYGSNLLFPPPETYYLSERKVCTPAFLNLRERTILLQVNGPAGNSGVAWGDSGEPLFWTDPETGEELVVAIARTANAPNFLSIARHYRVDTKLVHDFIQEVIDGL
jgi:hypothetical protein